MLALFISFACAHAASYCDEAGWTQVWGDEFNSPTLDSSKWTITHGKNGGQLRDAWGLASNVAVVGGALLLTSHKEHPTESPDFNFTSGAVVSKDKGFWKGADNTRVCVMAKLPGRDGSTSNGVWPAHWMMPNDNSCWPDHGEIDIMEMIDGDGQSHATYHWDSGYPGTNCTGPANNVQVGDQVTVDTWRSEWHEYAVEYTSSSTVTFVVDGQVVSTVTPDSEAQGHKAQFFPATPYYLILNTAIGGPWPKPVDDKTVFPAVHSIDWVHVSQKH